MAALWQIEQSQTKQTANNREQWRRKASDEGPTQVCASDGFGQVGAL
jgi:hypothetical protein